MPRAFLQQLPTGPRVELVHELTRLGRGKQCEFPVESSSLGREHSLVLRRSSGFWICDLQSSGGTWLARRGAKAIRVGGAVATLIDGDVINPISPVRFSLDQPDPLEQELCAAVVARPDDGAGWNAYREWLLAHGDPRGRRIDTASTALGWPGTDPGSLQLSITWANGHVREARLRELRHSGVELIACLRALLWAPASEFMTSLELELLPGAQRSVEGTLAHQIIEAVRGLLEGSRLPALRRLRVSSPLDARLELPHSPWLEAR